MATVGGRSFDETAESVRLKMDGVRPEDIRQHYVDVNGTKYPPKQVLAVMTNWKRGSYTTMEAQRVLGKIGFASHRADESPQPQSHDRLVRLADAVTVLQEAVASLSARVSRLEDAA